MSLLHDMQLILRKLVIAVEFTELTVDDARDDDDDYEHDEDDAQSTVTSASAEAVCIGDKNAKSQESCKYKSKLRYYHNKCSTNFIAYTAGVDLLPAATGCGC